MKIAITITSLVLGITGIAVVTMYGGWQIAAGVFVMMWADNLSKEVNR